jgi:sulfite exporter TauE/SafE
VTELLLSVLAASFVGSLHCAGMCGGLVAFCAGSDGQGTLARRQAAYQGTRLAAYVTLGAVGGFLGAGLNDIGMRVGISRVAAVVAGATMLVWATVLLLDTSVLASRVRLPAPLRRAVGHFMTRLRERPPVVRAALMGLASALLPCGWLYAFVLVAAGTGSAASGAVTMAAFWLGTVPALLGVSLGVRALAQRVGRRLPVLSALALIAVGLTTVLSRAAMPLPVAAATHAGTPVPADPPCHHHHGH